MEQLHGQQINGQQSPIRAIHMMKPQKPMMPVQSVLTKPNSHRKRKDLSYTSRSSSDSASSSSGSTQSGTTLSGSDDDGDDEPIPDTKQNFNITIPNEQK